MNNTIRDVIDAQKKEYLRMIGVVRELSKEEADSSNNKFRYCFKSNKKLDGYRLNGHTKQYEKMAWAEYVDVSDDEFLLLTQLLNPLSQQYLHAIDRKLRTIKHVLQFFLLLVILGFFLTIVASVLVEL